MNFYIRYNLINFSEIDETTIKAYCELHNESKIKNIGDISKANIDELPSCDILTHGSPCQNFSTIGLMEGGDENTSTKSSLMWYSVKCIEQCKPKFVVWENVKGILSKKHIHNFNKYLEKLKTFGYKNYWELLNSKDYNVPQNRERVIVVSIRKDIDCGYEFPKRKELNVFLSDVIQKEFDTGFTSQCKRLKKLTDKYVLEKGVVYYLDLHNCSINKKLCGTLQLPNHNKQRIFDGKYIRKISSLEHIKLMGYEDVDYEKLYALNIADSNIQKMMANSIVVNVLVETFKKLKEYYPDDFKEGVGLVSLFSGVGAFEKAIKCV